MAPTSLRVRAEILQWPSRLLEIWLPGTFSPRLTLRYTSSAPATLASSLCFKYTRQAPAFYLEQSFPGSHLALSLTSFWLWLRCHLLSEAHPDCSPNNTPSPTSVPLTLPPAAPHSAPLSVYICVPVRLFSLSLLKCDLYDSRDHSSF